MYMTAHFGPWRHVVSALLASCLPLCSHSIRSICCAFVQIRNAGVWTLSYRCRWRAIYLRWLKVGSHCSDKSVSGRKVHCHKVLRFSFILIVVPNVLMKHFSASLCISTERKHFWYRFVLYTICQPVSRSVFCLTESVLWQNGWVDPDADWAGWWVESVEEWV